MAHENEHFSSGNYETRSSKFVDENAKCRVEFETSCSYLRLAARLSELASKLERLSCSHWVCSKYRREYQSKLLTDHSSGKRCNCWRSLRWDDRRSLFNERTLLHSMQSFLNIFTKIKLLIISRHSSISVFCFTSVSYMRRVTECWLAETKGMFFS